MKPDSAACWVTDQCACSFSQAWLAELNAFKAAALAEWRQRPTYDATHTRPGGMSLLAYGHRKGVSDRTVMVMDLLVAGRPAMIDSGAWQGVHGLCAPAYMLDNGLR